MAKVNCIWDFKNIKENSVTCAESEYTTFRKDNITAYRRSGANGGKHVYAVQGSRGEKTRKGRSTNLNFDLNQPMTLGGG